MWRCNIIGRHHKFNMIRNQTIYQDIQLFDSRRIWWSTSGNRSRGRAIAEHNQTPFFLHLQTRSHWKKCGLVLNALFKNCVLTVRVVMQLYCKSANGIRYWWYQAIWGNWKFLQSDNGQTDQISSDESSGSDSMMMMQSVQEILYGVCMDASCTMHEYAH